MCFNDFSTNWRFSKINKFISPLLATRRRHKMTDLLKNALQPLQEHTIPEKFTNDQAATVDLATKDRYVEARNKYLSHRVEETMME